jgi:hypothetical protein
MKKKVSEKKPRTHRVSFLLNDDEYKAVVRHIKKYKIKNKSQWQRTLLMKEVWKKISEDYPTLFDENEMR